MEMPYIQVDRTLVFMIRMESHMCHAKQGIVVKIFLFRSLVIVIQIQRSDDKWKCHTCKLTEH